jgi:hypothetical protein
MQVEYRVKSPKFLLHVFQYYYLNIKILKFYENWNVWNFLIFWSFHIFWKFLTLNFFHFFLFYNIWMNIFKSCPLPCFCLIRKSNSYLMDVDAIDQTICPEVLGMTKCSIAWGQRSNAIEHLVIPKNFQKNSNISVFIKFQNFNI